MEKFFHNLSNNAVNLLKSKNPVAVFHPAPNLINQIVDNSDIKNRVPVLYL